MMKLLVIGATGRAGSLLVNYALEKGHEVTAFARNPEAVPQAHERLVKVPGDVLYPSMIRQALPGQDAVLSVIGLRQYSGPISLLSKGISNIVESMEKYGCRRLITITGAGILQEDEDHLIMDSLSFPPNLQNISLDHLRVYERLKASDLDWTIVAPAFMKDGRRTGQYLLEADRYPKKAENRISVEDVADFMLREVVENKYVRKRVGIAYPL